MKIRVVLLTENDSKNTGLTEAQVRQAWQSFLNGIALYSEYNDRAIVEEVKILED